MKLRLTYIAPALGQSAVSQMSPATTVTSADVGELDRLQRWLECGHGELHCE
ncbi:hypothetical protein PC116_g18397 [Phytophthora cactorum]|nr:hypothetical protein PC116_g18397 [Phytophthora cactorum]